MLALTIILTAAPTTLFAGLYDSQRVNQRPTIQRLPLLNGRGSDPTIALTACLDHLSAGLGSSIIIAVRPGRRLKGLNCVVRFDHLKRIKFIHCLKFTLIAHTAGLLGNYEMVVWFLTVHSSTFSWINIQNFHQEQNLCQQILPQKSLWRCPSRGSPQYMETTSGGGDNIDKVSW